MNDREFDALVNRIQEEVFAEAREALGDKGFDRWRNPRYCGRMDDCDSSACLTGTCGDTMWMYIKTDNNRLNEVSYCTDGCSSSSVAGSFAAQLGTGKTFEEVLDLTGADVLREIGSFPKGEEHCAHLAIRTLQEAVNSYLVEVVRREKDRL
jgi:nitrogen fixation NifU-like protein